MSTATSKQVPKLTKKAKVAVEERQALLKKLPNSSTDVANDKTPSEAASTTPLTKCKNVNSSDAVTKKAHKMANIDEDVLTDEEPAHKNKMGNVDEDVPTDEEPARSTSPEVEPEENPEDELGTFKDLLNHITFNVFCRVHVEGMVLTSLSIL